MQWQESEHARLAHKISAQVQKEIASQYKLKSMGYGGGMMDQVNFMSLSFQSDCPLQVDEVRRILVESLDLFLERINSNQEIRQYLCQAPFPIENIEIVIYFYNKKFVVDTGELYFAGVSDGAIRYYEKTDGPMAKKILSETIEEARERLRKH